MSLKIRLQRRGRRKQPFYHIVIADARSPRDGKFIEKIGTYNPMTSPATIDLDNDRAFEWIQKGAQPTDTTRSILRFKGVLFKKHLTRGVTKGAMTPEEADVKYNAWIEEKEAKIEARRKKVAEEKAEWLKKLSGTAKKVSSPLAGPSDDEHKPTAENKQSFADSVEQTTVESFSTAPEAAAEEAAEVEATATEEAAPTTEEAPASEEAPATEETAAKAETPADKTPADDAAAEEEKKEDKE